jgi:AraC-like DNA-binding protein
MKAKSKPGPKPVVPTTRQRHHVELAVSIGMSLEDIADAMDLSRRTLCRTFAREVAVGRAKRLLASAVRLDAMADAGNVSAAKFLHGLMMNHGNNPETAQDDKWAAVASRIEAGLDCEENPNLPKKGEFWKHN